MNHREQILFLLRVYDREIRAKLDQMQAMIAGLDKPVPRRRKKKEVNNP